MPIVLKSTQANLIKYALPEKSSHESEPELWPSMEDARLHIYMCARLLMSPKLLAEFDHFHYIRSELNAAYAVKRGAVRRVCRYFSRHLVCTHCQSCRRVRVSEMFTATCDACLHFPTEKEWRQASMLSSEVNIMFWAVDRPYMDEFLDHYLTE
jgi:hypothetical protein